MIDWEDAAIGDPLADVANARLEVLWGHGTHATNEFTRRYRLQAPAVDFTELPRWDLWAARRLTPRLTEWGLDAATEHSMREKSELFVVNAREALSH